MSEMTGRKVSCVVCGHTFELRQPSGQPVQSSSDEYPIYRPDPVREQTLSRSMLPVRSGPAVPADEMLGRLEPGTLRWVNASSALVAFLGRPLEELRRHFFPEYLHPDDRALAEDEFRKAAEIGERHDFTLRFPGEGRSMRYVRVYSQARYNPDGTINHLRCYLKDVTERVQAEQELRRRTEQLTAANEQLRQTNRKLAEAQSQLVHTEKLASLGTLASGMAHEINNPLAFAMNNVSVLGRDVADLLRLLAMFREGWKGLEASQPELAQRIERFEAEVDVAYVCEHLPRITDATRQGLQRVAKIVENLREFAQLDRPEVALVDVNAALDHSLGMLTGAFAEHRVRVERDYHEVPLLECAGAPMNQVFLNLLMNALQAIDSARRTEGRVKVATRASADEIVVEVTDNGCGMTPEVVSKVFDPFFTTKPVGRGTGLGLSMSHGTVSEHGGSIEIESTPGEGSLFRVRLPTRRHREPAD